MVEELIKRCIKDGYFAAQPSGLVYPVADAIFGINGTIEHELGLHARPVTIFVHKAQELGIDRAYVVKGDRYGHSGSIMSLLMLAAPKGTPVSLVANHGTEPEQLQQLYRVLVGRQ